MPKGKTFSVINSAQEVMFLVALVGVCVCLFATLRKKTLMSCEI